jgi:hypothetical protein
MFKTIIKILPIFMGNRHNSVKVNTVHNNEPLKSPDGFWTNLVKNDNNFSTVNFFLLAATIVGIVLLIVPVAAMIVDLYYNHTITINLSDMAAYIVAVAGIFGAAGITNAWTEYSYQRYHKNIFKDNNSQNDYNNNDYNCEP